MNLRATPLVWRPDANAETSKKLGGSCEVSALSLKSGVGATTIALYDATTLSECTPNALRWVLDSAAAGNDNQNLSIPLNFKKGLFAVMEQGVGTNAALCVAAVNYIP